MDNQSPSNPSIQEEGSVSEFTQRCPLHHESLAKFTVECPLARQRLYWLENNPKRTEAEEDDAPGCPWAIESWPEFHGCWWKFMANSGINGIGCTEEYIAEALHLSLRHVRETLAHCKKKMNTHELIAEMKDLHSTGDLFPQSHADDDDLDFYTPTGFSFVSHDTRTHGAGEDDGTVVAAPVDGAAPQRIIRRGPKITPLVPAPDL
jgi:hypothetical protein